MTVNLAVFGSDRKPHVAKLKNGHASHMRSEFQELFVRRLGEEMAERKMSANTLAGLSKVGQTSISRMLRGEQDPTLDKVAKLADALGVPAWYLLVEANTVEQKIVRLPVKSSNVTQLPSYPRIFAKQSENRKLPKKSQPARKRS